MQDDKWLEILDKVKDGFEVINEGKEDLDPGPGFEEFIEFNGPLGKMRLERTTRPVVLDKKGIGSRRIGSQSTVKYIYSDTEKTHTFKAYKWEERQDDWVEMDAGPSSFSF